MIQLRDNQSAVLVDENMDNIFKHNDLPPIRAQQEAYKYLEQETYK